MKRFLTVLILLAAATALFAQQKTKAELTNYSFSSKDLDGATISSELYANNKITMINIWGTFCGPCIREMPDLEKLSQANKDKGFQIIGIPIDLVDDFGRIIPSAKKDANLIITQTGVTYKNVVPTHDMMAGFLRGIQVVPTTIFVDKNGHQIGQIYLGSRSQKDWQKILDKLLESQQ